MPPISAGEQHAVAAVIVHWGDVRRTLDLVDQVRSEPLFSRIVVVANDGTPPPREAVDHRVSWLPTSRNLGYGAACQLGAETVGAEKYAFLNNDLRLPPGTAAKCLSALDRPGVGITGPVLRYPDGRLQSGCGSFSPFLQAPRVGREPDAAYARCSWVTGAALFARAEVVRDVQFDGSYFLGFEDSDLCLRAAARGWAILCLADAAAGHAGMTTVTESRWQYYTVRNRIWFCRRLRSRSVAAAVWLWSALVLLPRVMIADVLKARGCTATRSILRAVVDGRAPLPPFGVAWPHEPVPARWLAW